TRGFGLIRREHQTDTGSRSMHDRALEVPLGRPGHELNRRCGLTDASRTTDPATKSRVAPSGVMVAFTSGNTARGIGRSSHPTDRPTDSPMEVRSTDPSGWPRASLPVTI